MAGAGAVEIDVQVTLDGRLAVIHDATLDRTTSGRGPLLERAWEELRELDAGAWFSPRFAGEGLLDLDAALALLRGRVAVIVEIKARAERQASLCKPRQNSMFLRSSEASGRTQPPVAVGAAAVPGGFGRPGPGAAPPLEAGAGPVLY